MFGFGLQNEKCFHRSDQLAVKQNYLLLGSDLVEIPFHPHQLHSLEAHNSLCFTSY